MEGCAQCAWGEKTFWKGMYIAHWSKKRFGKVYILCIGLKNGLEGYVQVPNRNWLIQAASGWPTMVKLGECLADDGIKKAFIVVG